MEEDIVILALTLFRECRGEPAEGKIAVANVLSNRVKKNHSSFYAECVKPLQFSSLTSKGDSQLIVWPFLTDPVYINLKNIAYAAVNGSLPDITNGSTLYYEPRSILSGKTISFSDGTKAPFPSTWNPQAVQVTGYFGKQLFLKEI